MKIFLRAILIVFFLSLASFAEDPPLKIDADGFEKKIISQVPEEVFRSYPEAPLLELAVTWLGSRMILDRKYVQAEDLLTKFGRKKPQSLITPLGMMFLWHVQMVENWDFRFAKKFEEAEKNSKRIFKTYYDEEVTNRWHNLIIGGNLGMRGLWSARYRRFFRAASFGWESMGYMKKVGETRPNLPPIYDYYYGTGMYHYWTTWASQKSFLLFFFPDRRKQGLEEIAVCANKAPISSTLAKFSLAYLYGHEGEFSQALEWLTPIYEKHPQSIIVGTLLARLLLTSGQGDEGIVILEALVEQEPTYGFIGFHLARALYLSNRDPERVKILLEAFLNEKNVLRLPSYISVASFYLAEIYSSQQKWERAKTYLTKVNKSHLSPVERKRFVSLKKALEN